MKGARGVLINITGGMDMTLFEVDEAANRIRSEVDPDANIIVGSTFDMEMEGRMRVSVVATGIESGIGDAAPGPAGHDQHQPSAAARAGGAARDIAGAPSGRGGGGDGGGHGPGFTPQPMTAPAAAVAQAQPIEVPVQQQMPAVAEAPMPAVAQAPAPSPYGQMDQQRVSSAAPSRSARQWNRRRFGAAASSR